MSSSLRIVRVAFRLSDEERDIVLETMRVAADVFNEHVDWAIKNKSTSVTKAHWDLSKKIRAERPEFPSNLLARMRSKAFGAVKQTKFSRRPRKRSTTSIDYDANTMSLRGSLLTFSTVDRRIRTSVTFGDRNERMIESAVRRKGAATLGYSKRKNKFYVSFVYEFEDEEKREIGRAVGIDRGLKNPIVTSDGEFFGQELCGHKRRYTYLRQSLSTKGTRSARRCLQRLSGREKRFSADVNHRVSKELASRSDVKSYVIEDLKGIRKNGAKGKRRKSFNRRLNSWPFAQFEFFLRYKCLSNGIEVVKVDPKYTSQTCNVCGHVDKKNRNGNVFRCLNCGRIVHADVNAAMNVRDRHVLTSRYIRDAGCSQSPRRTNKINVEVQGHSLVL